MSQLFTLYYPKWYFILQQDFSLSFKSLLPFEFLVAKNGNVYVDRIDWNDSHYLESDFDEFKCKGLQNGLTVISINGQSMSDIDDINNDKIESIVVDNKEEEISITFSEELKPFDDSSSIGLTYNDDHKQHKVVENAQIAASSFQKGYEPSQCRLNNPNSCWKPSINDRAQWILFDLETKTPITKLYIQGSLDNASYVERFWIDYSDDGCDWTTHSSETNKCQYTDSGIATIKLWPTIYAQFIRIRPYKWINNIAMRLDFFGTRHYHPQFGRTITYDTANEEERNGLQSIMETECSKVMQVDSKAVVHAALHQSGITSYGTFLVSDNKHYITNFTTANHVFSEQAMDALTDAGIGREIGVLSAVNLSYRSVSQKEQESLETEAPIIKSKTEGFYRSMKSRDVLQQVVEQVVDSATLDFDYLAMLLAASLIAVGGLITNSVVAVVASMLVSPIMGPVLAFTFGITLKGEEFRNLAKMGFINELISLFICVLVGFLNGFVLFMCVSPDRIHEWPTEEMLSRGKAHGLLSGAYIAAASGIGVGLSVLSEYMAAVVGVAISASLLPPAVNSGILLSLATVISIDADREENSELEMGIILEMASYTLLLCLENIIIICIVARLVFWIKNVYVADDHQNVSIWASITYFKREYMKKHKSVPMRRRFTMIPNGSINPFKSIRDVLSPYPHDINNNDIALKGILMRQATNKMAMDRDNLLHGEVRIDLLNVKSPLLPLPSISNT